MSKYKYYQPNKKDLKDKYGDCVIRCFCKLTGEEWLTVFKGLVEIACEFQSMPNNKIVYEAYLSERGYVWHGLKAIKGKKRETPESFCKTHKTGTYVLSLANHCVCVKDGYYYDTWDCGSSCVYGYYGKSE